ncbi:MAG: glycosyltransferase family 4 protein [Solirubrobacteraceae bacterium]
MTLDVVAFPQDPNPYQELLYAELRKRGDRIAYAGRLTPSRTLNLLALPLELLVRRLRGASVFHLHWAFGFSFPPPVPRSLSRRWFELILAVLRACRYRVVWTAHNVLPHEPVFDDDRTARRSLVSACDLVIAHSEHALAGLRELGAAPANAAVMPLGPMAPDGLAGIAPPAASRPRSLLFAGRIAAYKGVEDLLAALGEPGPELRVTIVGACVDAELRLRLQLAAASLGDDVSLRLGFVSDAELVGLLTAADGVVLPFRSVTTSSSVLLGMAAGRMLVIPDLAQLSAVPQDAALRYPPGVDGLRAALRAFAEMPADDLRARGEAARRAAAPATWARVATMTRDAIAGGRPPVGTVQP